MSAALDAVARAKRSRQVMAELRARRAAMARLLPAAPAPLSMIPPTPTNFAVSPPAPRTAPLILERHTATAPSRIAVLAARRREDIRLFFETRVDLKTDPAMQSDWCDECGCRHNAANRQARLRAAGEMNPEAARDFLGACGWPRSPAGDRKLLRDLAAVFGPATSWSRHHER